MKYMSLLIYQYAHTYIHICVCTCMHKIENREALSQRKCSCWIGMCIAYVRAVNTHIYTCTSVYTLTYTYLLPRVRTHIYRQIYTVYIYTVHNTQYLPIYICIYSFCIHPPYIFVSLYPSAYPYTWTRKYTSGMSGEYNKYLYLEPSSVIFLVTQKAVCPLLVTLTRSFM